MFISHGVIWRIYQSRNTCGPYKFPKQTKNSTSKSNVLKNQCKRSAFCFSVDFQWELSFNNNKNKIKRSAFCFSVDFQANEAQAALNGQVSALVGGLPHHHNYHHCHHHNFLFVGFIINLMITQVKNPDTAPNFFGRFDGNKLEADQTGARYVFRLGRWQSFKLLWSK